MEKILEFFQENMIAKISLDAYFLLIIITFLIALAFKVRKLVPLAFVGILLWGIKWFSTEAGLEISSSLYSYVLSIYVIMCIVIIVPDIRKFMESGRQSNNRSEIQFSSNQATKEAIADAVFHLSSQRVGALITMEQHNSLDQYSERAIQLNSDISRELIEQIFIKDSPLHDGGVIIRGNKIVCAGAYFVLTQDDTIDKTLGSRHRAGIGISEVTDSLTIIVSEETGAVHVATAGCMVAIDNKNALLEYINLFLGK